MMPLPVIDPVLTAVPPSFTPADAREIARRLFGIDGTAQSAGSERDQTFLFDGDPPAVLKISNAAEDPSRLDMEALAALRIARVDPDLPVAVPRRVPGATDDGDAAVAYRALVDGPAGPHFVRAYDRLPGRASVAGASLSRHAVREWGAIAARVARSLRAFSHPAASRVMLWDPQHALRLRDLLPTVADARVEALVGRVLDRFESVVVPAWPTLRCQVIHTDLCTDNVLVDDEGAITGIIDFGDMAWSALVVEASSAVESLVQGRRGEDIFRTARLVIDGFQRVTSLEPAELAVFGELVAARACASVVVPASRAALYPDGDQLMADIRTDALALLETFDDVGWDEVGRGLGGREPGGQGWTAPDGAARGRLVGRRQAAFGSALTPLTYDEPLHLVRGEGVWLWDADGRRYLDGYNNVPVVGHAHPRVAEAMARQARLLNTNLRYLHETAIELAERLIATTEPALDTVMFVNSGSEANDLAWRIARAASGGSGGVCTDYAYHGVSEAITALSPEVWGDDAPGHVAAWRPSDGVAGFEGALVRLRELGHRPAAAILDGVLTSDGIVDLEPGIVGDVVRLTREAGALWIADEVQGGHGRTGDTLWAYQRLGIVPDIVTLGKPMGNGHPVAAVITTAELADRFGRTTDFFSTFGGNPVAASAALAVLAVIDDEELVANARNTGAYLRARLVEVARRSPLVGEVRAIGLAAAVEIVDPATSLPDREATQRIVNALRRAGVLVGTTARAGNVLKIRPPLVFRREHADLLVAALETTLA